MAAEPNRRNTRKMENNTPRHTHAHREVLREAKRKREKESHRDRGRLREYHGRLACVVGGQQRRLRLQQRSDDVTPRLLRRNVQR